MARVLVFVMKGCGACAEYVPRFKHLAGPHLRTGLAVEIIDIDSARGRKLARQFGIEATPTTVIHRADGGGWKQVGGVSDGAIRHTLALARRS